MDLNSSTLVGRMDSDPVLGGHPPGTTVLSFILARHRTLPTGDGPLQEEVALVSCAIYGEMATYLSGARKGEMAIVVGRLHPEPWKQDRAVGKRLVLIRCKVRPVKNQPLGARRAHAKGEPDTKSEQNAVPFLRISPARSRV